MKDLRLLRKIAILGALLMLVPVQAVAETADRTDTALSIISKQTVGKYGMTPIAGEFVADGDYTVEVESSSPYFDVTDAVLHVRDGKMTLDFVIPSKSYLRVFPGTAKEAKRSDSYIEGTIAEDGEGTCFTVDVSALNAPFSCAAYSKRKKKWYSRTLLVDASSLPAEALSFQLPDYELIQDSIVNAGGTGEGNSAVPRDEVETIVEPCSVDLEDGEYSIEVNMTGGSGRASISSPTRLIVENGQAWVELMWSSSHYDYMIVSGVRYENLNTDGGSSKFRIPIIGMDTPIPIIADTTAMGDPVEIAYTLIFYEDTIGDTSLIPQVAAKRVLIVSGILIAVGAILNFILTKKKIMH